MSSSMGISRFFANIRSLRRPISLNATRRDVSRFSSPHRVFHTRRFSSRPISAASSRFSLRRSLTLLRNLYPHIDPASLIASFLLLHELTAVVPLVLGFWGFHWVGVGEGLIRWAEGSGAGRSHGGEKGNDSDGWRGTVNSWIDEGMRKAERLGRRYGWFGYPKKDQIAVEGGEDQGSHSESPVGSHGSSGDQLTSDMIRKRIEGDVANLVAAYLVVKVSISFEIPR